jgi:RHS repeat-associated protein
VAEKRVDYAYSDDSRTATIARYADLEGTVAVAETDKVFDQLGRVTGIVHSRAATEFADYDLVGDAAGRITDFDFTSLVGDDGSGDYTYDDRDQLTGADYDFQTDESYTYDANGNRTITGYTTGDHNRLTSDGTYNYTYDNEGNVVTKTNISTNESVEYTWDHRNRLVKVTFRDDEGTADSQTIFVHDDGPIVLDFQDIGTEDLTNADLANRYLWGSAVDEILADETAEDGTADDTAWALTDHLKSVRDLVVYDPTPGTASVAKHLTYDAFGNVTSDTATGVESLFLYTARPFDSDTALQNNVNRWYDLSTGRWMSEDPIEADINLHPYCTNDPITRTDSTGCVSWSRDILSGPTLLGSGGRTGRSGTPDQPESGTKHRICETWLGAASGSWSRCPFPRSSRSFPARLGGT